MGYVIQERAIMHPIWFTPHDSHRVHGKVEADTVSELEATIRATADRWPFDWAGNFRIITVDGNPVSRWKVHAGDARKVARRY
jgi:hypothetical protein